jgi:glycosyltransferase involved in cell wall biosynthesis
MKTKIVYIYHSIAIYGGIERVLTDKTNQLAKDDNFDITIITTSQGEHPYPYIADKRVKRIDWGINFHRVYKYSLFKRLYLKWRKDRTFLKKLKEYIAKEQPDIIVSIGLYYSHAIHRMRGTIPWIVECHSDMAYISYNPLEYKMTPYQRWIKSKVFHTLQKSTTLVTLTQSDAEAWRTIHPSVRVIPNGLAPQPKREISLLNSKKVIFAGRFERQKNIDALFSIWSRVYIQKPDWALHIYGNGEEKNRYTSLDGQQNIHIHPATTQIFEKYSESSFLVLTSLYESFGLVLIEAMSCGLPVIAFDCPNGPREIITDGKDGFLIPMGNNALFAERIIYLMEHPEERLRMGRNALKKSERYSMEQIAEQWKQLYRELNTTNR